MAWIEERQGQNNGKTTKDFEEVKAMLGTASPAWEKLLGYIQYHYVMDEKWAEGKPTHKHCNNWFVRRSGKSLIRCFLDRKSVV